MKTRTTTEELAAFCVAARTHPYIALDTEFMRERTYFPKLCLMQMAVPGEGEGSAVLADPLAGNMSLEPLLDLFRDESVVKVFHAARQDLEIFFIEGEVFPRPLFDTQIAAMVCGFGEQVGYGTLVGKITGRPLNKTSRFTDWSRRPLSDAQKQYALADVTHLRAIYEHLAAEVERSGRGSWVREELEFLTAPETYIVHPEDAWRKIRTRSTSGRFLAVVKELARFRETCARERDVPRARIMKDEAILELASTRPRSLPELGRSRLLFREARKSEVAKGILAAIATGIEAKPVNAAPDSNDSEKGRTANPALADLLRVLLRARADSEGVARKLVAPAADLDAIASGERDVPALKGWRGKIFGKDALRLCNGEVALSVKGNRVEVVPISAPG